MKKKILITIGILILLVIVIFISTGKKDKKTSVNRLNNNPNVIKDQTIENLSITNVAITIDKNNVSTFTADVTNTANYANTIETINIILKDKTNTVLATLTGFIGNINKGEISKISVSTDIDLSKASSIEYKKGE